MAKTAIVNCKVPNGLLLRRFDMREGELGIKSAVLVGEPVALKFGDNEGIDSAFITAWLKDNADHEAVKSGLITINKPEKSA